MTTISLARAGFGGKPMKLVLSAAKYYHSKRPHLNRKFLVTQRFAECCKCLRLQVRGTSSTFFKLASSHIITRTGSVPSYNKTITYIYILYYFKNIEILNYTIDLWEIAKNTIFKVSFFMFTLTTFILIFNVG